MKNILLLVLILAGTVLYADARRWQSIGPAAGSIRQLVPDRRNPGCWFAINNGDLYRSVNAGDTWNLSLRGIGQVAVHPVNGEILAVGHRKVFESPDNGKTFQLRATLDFPLRRIIMNPRDSQVVFGFGLTQYDLAVSSNGGRAWSSIKNLPIKLTESYQYYGFEDLLFSPFDPQTIYATGVVEECYPFESCEMPFFLVSKDGGKTWRDMEEFYSRGPFTFHTDPLYPDRAFAFDGMDFLTLTQHGWETLSKISITGLISIPKHPDELIGFRAPYEQSTVEVYRSTDGGLTWKEIAIDLDDHVVSLGAVDDPFRTVLAGTNGGGIYKRNIRHGWQNSSKGLNSAWISDIEVSGRRLYALSVEDLDLPIGDFLYRSDDSGLNWLDLTFEVPLRKSDWIYSMAVNPHDSSHVIAATSEGLLITTDAGIKWKRVSLIPVDRLMFDPLRSNVVYALVVGSLYKSADGGMTWRKPPLKNLEADRYSVERVVIDPNRAQTLYLLTRPVFSGDGGRLYKSFDGGGTVQLAGGGLPVLAVPRDMTPLNQPDSYMMITSQGEIFQTSNGGERWRYLSRIKETKDHSIFTRIQAVDQKNLSFFAIFDSSRSAQEPQLYESRDGAVTWRNITSEFGTQAVVIDITAPQKSGLYVGTNHGVFKLVY